jgi:pimeloyl-ACP methyl ester carboxylesterase
MQYVEINSNNNILRGFLELPQNPKALVIMFHGFTGHKVENGFMFKQFSQTLSAEGFASLRMDFSGSGDSDGEFHDMTILTEINDAQAIVDFAKNLGIEKLFVLGFSMGGAVASMISSDYIDCLTGLILLAPAGNMGEKARDYEKRLVKITEEHYDMGGFLVGQPFIEALSDLDLYQNAPKFTKPVLIVHGENDLAVPFEVGKKYASLYPNAEFHLIEGASHCFTTYRNRQELQEKIIAFLERTIGD